MEESWLTNSGCPAARSAAEHGFLRGTQIEGKPSILRLNAEAFRPGFANRARAIFGLGPSRALDRGGHRSDEGRRASRALGRDSQTRPQENNQRAASPCAAARSRPNR